MPDTHRKESAGRDSNVAEDSGSVKGGEGKDPCTCGLCDGVEIEYAEDPKTGEVSSFTKMSRKARCPQCGGWNVRYRTSYTAHVAQLVKRLERRNGPNGLSARAVPRFVTVTLEDEAVEAAGLEPEESYGLWTGDGAPWSKARREVRDRDGDAVYVGTLSARPSDGTYHLHILIITPLSAAEIRDAFHVAGLDTYIQGPIRDADANESAEQFAARKAAYAFDNAGRGPSSRFVSSNQGHGEGYDSTAAKERRRAAARSREANSGTESDPETDGPRAGGHRRNPRQSGDGEPPDTGPDTGENEPKSGGRRSRPPPIRGEGRRFDTLDAYTDAVKSLLTGRIGTEVALSGGEVARLLAVRTAREEERGLLRCCVHVEPEAEVRHVTWRDIKATNTPTVRTSPPNRGGRPSPPSKNREEPGESPVERYNAAATTSKVTVELADGRRHVTEKNHRTGETREYTLPPRPR